MSTFLDLIDGVKAYYGSGSDEWLTIAQGGVTPDTIPIIQQVPGVTITRSASGAVLGYDYANPFPTSSSPASVINSNVQTGSYGLTSYHADLPATAVTDPVTGDITLRSGSVVQSTGQTLATVADRATLALAGVAIGSKLGLAIDSALYAANPEWWDEHFPSLNPQTWEQLIPGGTAGNVIRGLVGIGDDDATMYMDERLIAYAYQTLLQGGAFGSGDATVDYHGSTEGLDMTGIELPIQLSTLLAYKGTYGSSTTTWTMSSTSDRTCAYRYSDPSTPTRITTGMISASLTSDLDITTMYFNQTDHHPGQVRTLKGETYYIAVDERWTYLDDYEQRTPVQDLDERPTSWPTFGYILLFGDYDPGETPAGIVPNPEAGTHINPTLVINPTTGEPVTPEDDLDDALQGLKNAYPGLFTGTIYEDVPQDDGTVARISYSPVPYPNTDPQGNPITDTTAGVDPQTDPQVDPQARPDAAQGLTDSLTTPPAPPDTGSGTGPQPVIPSGSASALYSIYNPTPGELSDFGAWLWSSSFVDQLLKLFSDPMQAIIGLHKVFCDPPVSGRGNIKVGYLDSGVATNLVSGQYVTVPCGSVSLPEYFGNVFDYSPYTQVQIYLPFVGIEPLDVGDVMRGTLTVTYHIDVLTGACLAEVSVSRDSAGGILYTYAGNAAVQYPISSGSYMGILSTVISVAGGIAGTIASGGALAPLALGAAGGLMSAKTRVQHSGGFSGNAGAMGARKPYLIITRPQSATAREFESYEGYPANHTTTLGACSGFVRVKVAHLDGIPAMLQELTEIEQYLAEGVII